MPPTVTSRVAPEGPQYRLDAPSRSTHAFLFERTPAGGADGVFALLEGGGIAIDAAGVASTPPGIGKCRIKIENQIGGFHVAASVGVFIRRRLVGMITKIV
jgi:hypothetical protein